MSGSNEVHYVEGDKKADKKLHEPILEEGDAVVAFVTTYNWLIGHGYSDGPIQAMYRSLHRAAKERKLI